MRLDEINRRGFLKGVAAGAAATAMPADIKGFITTVAKATGGTKNLSLLAQLIEAFGIESLNTFAEYAQGDISFAEILSDEESNDLADRLVSSSIVDPDSEEIEPDSNESIINYWTQVGEFDGNIYDAASEIIGYDIEYKKIVDLLEKNGTDQYDFFSHQDGVGEAISNAYSKAIEKYRQANLNADTIVQAARAVGVPANISRLAALVSSVIKHFVPNSTPASQQPEQPPSSQPPRTALPAPSNRDEIEGMSNIDRMKDLAGIQRK